jgi:hypothetical protein
MTHSVPTKVGRILGIHPSLPAAGTVLKKSTHESRARISFLFTSGGRESHPARPSLLLHGLFESFGGIEAVQDRININGTQALLALSTVVR